MAGPMSVTEGRSSLKKSQWLMWRLVTKLQKEKGQSPLGFPLLVRLHRLHIPQGMQFVLIRKMTSFEPTGTVSERSKNRQELHPDRTSAWKFPPASASTACYVAAHLTQKAGGKNRTRTYFRQQKQSSERTGELSGSSAPMWQ